MNLELNLKERLILALIMPKIGSMSEMRLAYNLVKKIGLTEVENETYKVRFENGNTLFDDNGSVFIFELKPDEADFLKLIVKHKDEDGKVEDIFFSIFDKIINL